MPETMVTFHGWVGGPVRHRTVGETAVATFRVGVTARRRREGEWVDGETAWYSVTAWRALADHVWQSVRKGDPVIVHGRLRTETWTPEEGTPTTTLTVDALLVGHDLSRGLTHFYKPSDRRRPDDAPGEGRPEGAGGAGPGAAGDPDPQVDPPAVAAPVPA